MPTLIKMEDLAPLTIVCRHLKSETRDATYVRLRKSKRAAHAQNCRLRAKLRRAERNNAVLLTAYLITTEQLRELHERITRFVQEEDPPADV